VLTERQALIESERCLRCFDAPCTKACPTHIPIPMFISMIQGGDPIGAAEVVKSANALANVCGEVCPEEVICQSVCTRAQQDAPVRIRELHAFATAVEAAHGFSPTVPFAGDGATVAVVGAGPAGLACAFELARLGLRLHLYEEHKRPGGVPHTSIPEFRLPAAALARDIDFLLPRMTLHRERVNAARLEALMREHRAVFLACGLGRDRALGIPGETLVGVEPVLSFLGRAKRGEAVALGARVIVVGGGNVSLDAACTARRLGAREVTLLYRRSELEMRVWKGELDEARRRGVEIRFLTYPFAVLGEGRVRAMRCARMELTDERDASGRAVARPVEGSAFELLADLVVIAVGQRVGTELPQGLERNAEGFIRVDADFRTSLPGVFAGGDAIAGEGTIVQAVAHGRRVAHAIAHSLEEVRS